MGGNNLHIPPFPNPLTFVAASHNEEAGKGENPMIERIETAAGFLASKMERKAQIGMITGTGLGGVTERMRIDLRLSYEEIPHFPVTTTEGHKGTLVLGELGGKLVLALEGRFHLYEGHTPQEVTFPIRVMKSLGIEYLFVASAAGGLNPQFVTGDIMVLTDHINLTGMNPLVGPNPDAYGPRFPDMVAVYDRDLIDLAKKKALEHEIHLHQGVYVGILGPSLETPAETRFLRSIGADAVGMSTVSEVIVGVQCGLRILAIVAITNVNLPDCMEKTSIEKVIQTAERTGPTIAELWESVIRSLPD
jgi:purine-nucleoside phosphorylase